MKGTQIFTKAYLEECQKLSPEQIVSFLEDFRTLQADASPDPTRLISVRVPESLLRAFKEKSKLHRLSYQKQIKKLMRDWVAKKGA